MRILAVALALVCAAAAQTSEADLVLLNGKILTVDAGDSIAEAVAIANGKIVAVGSNDAVRRRASSKTQVIDLHGQTVTPGLIDSHCHFQEAESLYNVDLSVPEVSRIDDVLKLVRGKVASVKPGEWVQGSGWDEGKFAELRVLRASDLDKAAPANPVWLRQTTAHYGVANSAALKLAGIVKETRDPPAGTIDRDAEGRPTGVLKESAMGLVTRLIPRLSRDQERNGLLKIIADFNSEGMTAVKYPSIGQGQWDLLNSVLADGKLTVRVAALFAGGRTVESARQTVERLKTLPRPPQSLGDGRLLAAGVKLYMDGSGGARTAWLHQEWNRNFREKDEGNVGYPTTEPEVFRRQVRLIHDAGIHVSTHAVGDRAIDWVVDTYAEALKANPAKGLRHGIIHCNIPTGHAIDAMAALQKQYDAGYPEAQATFMWWIGDNYAGNFGPERSLRLMPFHTYLAKGVKWAGGSDYGVTPFAARYGLWSSVVRKPLKEAYGAQPFGMAESVDVHTALRSYTIWAARQLFLEDRIGSIEVGKDADLAVWDRDLYSMPADTIRDLKCQMTVMAGRVVYRAAAGGQR